VGTVPKNTCGYYFNLELWLDFLDPTQNTVAMHQSLGALAVVVLCCLASLVDVKIYSDADSVELQINGVSQGSHQSLGNPVFLWKQVQRAEGENHFAALAVRQGVSLRDSCVWNYSPAK
jgi:hypothetical protein